jgi:hypothetical protein
MLVKSAKYIFFILLTASLALTSAGVAQQPPNNVWKSLPLTTGAQKLAGMTGGEGMQRIFGISYAPSDARIAYLVSDTSGVWRGEWKELEQMTDYPLFEGFFWESKRTGFRASGGISIGVDPTNENVLFVSASKHNATYNSDLNGIYRTLDGGDSWEHVFVTQYERNEEGQHFVFDPDTSDGIKGQHLTIYAATNYDGLLKSTDGGYDCAHFSKDGVTTIQGDLTISDGTVTIKNLVLQ